MRWRLKQFFALAGLTALETIRQPVCLIVATSCLAFIAVLPLIISHTLGNADKLVRDSALALHFVCGLLLGGYAACSTLNHEIRRGTAASVLSKPVGRGLFFLAKFAGVAAVMLLFSLAAAISTLLAVRTVTDDFITNWWAAGPLLAALVLAHAAAGVRNFVTRRPFPSAAFTFLVGALVLALLVAASVSADGRLMPFGADRFPWPIVPASVLITLAILVIAGLAVSLATRLDTLPTLTVCAAVFLVGLVSDYLFGRHAATSAAAAFCYAVIPNWQQFWAADALSGNHPIPWHYVAWAGLYATLYLTGVLSLGMLAFRHMEVKA